MVRAVHLQVAAKPITNSPDEDLQLCQAFAACKSANILVTESSACCRLCSNEIMWRVELCPACRGTFTGFTFYHMQAAYKAIHSGKLNLFFNCFTEEVCALLTVSLLCSLQANRPLCLARRSYSQHNMLHAIEYRSGQNCLTTLTLVNNPCQHLQIQPMPFLISLCSPGN